MFKRKSSITSNGFDTVVGVNSAFEGSIVSEGSIRVDGKVKGDLKAGGDIYIGSNAVVTGNLYANDIHIAGTVEGNIQSNGILKILSTARLFGDINVHSFVADEGGLFQGKCCMLEASQGASSMEKVPVKKSHSNRDYKKSSVLGQTFEEKDKSSEAQEA